jgi:histone H4
MSDVASADDFDNVDLSAPSMSPSQFNELLTQKDASAEEPRAKTKPTHAQLLMDYTHRGGKRLPEGFTRRHKKKPLKPALAGITKGDVRRLARRGGVVRMNEHCPDTIRDALKEFMTKIMKDAVLYSDIAGRRTIVQEDITRSLKRHGRPLYV